MLPSRHESNIDSYGHDWNSSIPITSAKQNERVLRERLLVSSLYQTVGRDCPTTVTSPLSDKRPSNESNALRSFLVRLNRQTSIIRKHISELYGKKAVESRMSLEIVIVGKVILREENCKTKTNESNGIT